MKKALITTAALTAAGLFTLRGNVEILDLLHRREELAQGRGDGRTDQDEAGDAHDDSHHQDKERQGIILTVVIHMFLLFSAGAEPEHHADDGGRRNKYNGMELLGGLDMVGQDVQYRRKTDAQPVDAAAHDQLT